MKKNILFFVLFLISHSSKAFMPRIANRAVFNNASNVIKRMYATCDSDELKRLKILKNFWMVAALTGAGFSIFKTITDYPADETEKILRRKLDTSDAKLEKLTSKLESLNKLKQSEKAKLNSQISLLAQENSRIKVLLDHVHSSEGDISQKLPSLIEAVVNSEKNLETIKNELTDLKNRHESIIQEIAQPQVSENSEENKIDNNSDVNKNKPKRRHSKRRNHNKKRQQESSTQYSLTIL